MDWLPVETTVAPAAEPITVAEAKAHLNVDHSNDDTLIGALIVAARQHVEAYTGTRLVTQTVKLRAAAFDSSHFRFPVAPLQSATIEYVDTAGATQTLATTVYSVLPYGLSPSIARKYDQTWPATRELPDAITITAVVGYGAAAAVPAPIVHAIKLLLSDWYDNRADTNVGNITNSMPNGVEALLTNYRVFGF